MDKMAQPKLPIANELGYYEIRMESIGGMGANLAGQILAEACILNMGYNGVNFASYGSEKKGTPVKSFIRLCATDQEVTDNAPVENPHMLAVFAEGLIGGVPITQGFQKGGVVVVNTTRTPEQVMDDLKLPGCKIFCVDALTISMETKVPINTAILGAISRGSGFITPESIKDVITAKIGKRYPHLVDGNMAAFDRGYNEIVEGDFSDSDKYPEVEFHRAEPDLGYVNEPIGGIITNPGNTIVKNHGPSRTGYIPLWHEDKCIHCGDCDLTCPDHCMVYEKGTDAKGKENVMMIGVDYQYCKGCLRCVDICPTDALTAEVESEHDISAIKADIRRVL
jgi:pyruvate ferredoxin oxidoreductase gamma subunit